MVRPVKIGGGGGRTAHSPQLSGGLSLRTAPSGGCPSQPPASVTSSSNAQVSPRSHPPQVGGCCCGPGSGGGGAAHSGSRVGPSRTWWDAPGMEARCRQVSGPVRLPRHWRKLSCAKERKLFGDCGRALGNLDEFLLARRQECRWLFPYSC